MKLLNIFLLCTIILVSNIATYKITQYKNSRYTENAGHSIDEVANSRAQSSGREVQEDVRQDASDLYQLNLTGPAIFHPTQKEVSFSVNIKNLDVKPYMTDLNVFWCEFKDKNGNIFEAFISGERALDRVLLTGESAEIEYTRVRANPRLYDRKQETPCGNYDAETSLQDLKKCTFDKTGMCKCVDIGEVTITKCSFAASSDSFDSVEITQTLVFD